MDDARYCIRCGTSLVLERLDGRDRGRCPRCAWLWLDLPRPVVLVLAVSPSGRIVLTRDERFPPGQWGLVAGYVERGEDPCAAGLRELREETGLLGAHARVLGGDQYADNVLFLMRCDVASEELHPEPRTEVRLAAPSVSSIVPDSPARRLVARLLAGQCW